jgi:hypothetical protein
MSRPVNYVICLSFDVSFAQHLHRAVRAGESLAYAFQIQTRRKPAFATRPRKQT